MNISFLSFFVILFFSSFSNAREYTIYEQLTQISVKDLAHLKKIRDPFWRGLTHACGGIQDQECFIYEELFHTFQPCEMSSSLPLCLEFKKAYFDGFSPAFVELLLQEDLINQDRKLLKFQYPLIFRSVITNAPANEEFIAYKESDKGFMNHNKELRHFYPLIEKNLDVENQKVGFELECWPVKMALDYSMNLDNTIIKSCNEGEYTTYGLPIMCTEEELPKRTSMNFNPLFEVVFEQRYHSTQDPFIEIRSTPLDLQNSQFNWNVDRAKEIMSFIPEIIKEKGRLTLDEWIQILNEKTKDKFGLHWISLLGAWSHKNNWEKAYLKKHEIDILEKTQKMSLEENSFYFDTKQEGNYCILQSNLDVPLGKFFTAPDLINSLGANKKDINYRALYVGSRQFAKAIMTLEMEKAKNLLEFDPRDHVAGLLTLTIYQAFIRTNEYLQHKPVAKNSIPQLIKVPLTDLARSSHFSRKEQILFQRCIQYFLHLGYQSKDFAPFWQKIIPYMEEGFRFQFSLLEKEFYSEFIPLVQEFVSFWFGQNTYASRYPDDKSDSQGNIIEFGHRIVEDELHGTILSPTEKLPIEAGNMIPIKLIETSMGKEISVVVETRSSFSPFNFYVFWDKNPRHINVK